MAFPKFPGTFDIKISLLPNQGDAYEVTIHGQYTHISKSFDLNKACFDACCMALGWQVESKPVHRKPIHSINYTGELM